MMCAQGGEARTFGKSLATIICTLIRLGSAMIQEGDMKTVVVAFATIAATGCATHSTEDVRKADVATPIATSGLAGEDEIRPSCEEEYTGDWAMIAHCFERQLDGYRRLNP